MKFLNNLSKTTTDVLGAIIAVIIFWVGIQYFINPDFLIEHEEASKQTTIELEKKKD